ncbi:alpha-1,2-fucosyltransferase [Alphaproteobacteria bacterium]|nr:alpha-1,2-fucosyltransferase [Alphaproteobacteria bacterium]
MYHYPILSKPDIGFIRGPGPGFGNLLFPIGRALQEAQLKKQFFVRPTMLNFKLGPILRNERDFRFYQKEFKKRSFEDWIDFFRINIYRDKVKLYSGEGNLFYDIKKSDLLIKNWLLLNSLERPINNFGKIAVHIRRGDFLKSNKSDLSHQIPTQWYLDSVDRLICRFDMDVVLFSDSKVSNEWSKFGSRVTLSKNKSACSNVLSMSTADFLIGSRSTFSLWSYFLSKQKFLVPKDFDLTKYMNFNENVHYV